MELDEISVSPVKNIYIDRGGVRLHGLNHGYVEGPVNLMLHDAVGYVRW
jgi:hypothetical protein